MLRRSVRAKFLTVTGASHRQAIRRNNSFGAAPMRWRALLLANTYACRWHTGSAIEVRRTDAPDAYFQAMDASGFTLDDTSSLAMLDASLSHF